MTNTLGNVPSISVCENFPETCIRKRLLSAISDIITNGLQAIVGIFSITVFDCREGTREMSRDYIQRPGLLNRARIWTYFSEAHTSLSLEKLLDVEADRNPEQKWHWQNSETEGSVEVCTNILESSPFLQMKYLPLQPLIILKVSQEQISQGQLRHHREDEKDLMAWASSLKDTLLPKTPISPGVGMPSPLFFPIRFQH